MNNYSYYYKSVTVSTSRSRSHSEPDLFKTSKSRYRSISYSEYSEKSNRPVINGHITGGAIIIGNEDLKNVPPYYNFGDQSKLHSDHPSKLAALTLEQIKKFPNIELTDIVSDEMKKKSIQITGECRYGKDFIFSNCIKNKRFDDLPSNTHFLVEILVPTFDTAYKKIDVAAISEKTETCDNYNISRTIIRGLQEECGINFNTIHGKKILSNSYQENYRKAHNIKIPHEFRIGSYGSSTKIQVICAYADDLISCQETINEDTEFEIGCHRIEKMINKLLMDE